MDNFEEFFGNVRFVCKIGEGAFGEVNKVWHLTDNKYYAMKQSTSTIAGYEAQIMRQLNHPNLLKLIDSYQIIQFCNREFDVTTFMLFEYFPYDLHIFSTVIEQKTYAEQKIIIKLIMNQVLQGLGYMHRLEIAHRDIKPDNILVNHSYVTKICDFGMSEKISAAVPKNIWIQTYGFRAPEIIAGFPFYDKSIDIWSIGCTFFELVTRQTLFDTDELDPIVNICGNFSPEFLMQHQYFFENLSQKTNQKRQLESYLLNFISNTNYIKFIDLLLQMDPKKRLTASQALDTKILNLLN